MKRKAIIVGCNGQDGQLLAEHLTSKSYELTLLGRDNIDIACSDQVSQIISSVKPDEVYFLVAYHHSADDKQDSDIILLKKSSDIHMISAGYFLEAIAEYDLSTRFFYASSSHIYSDYAGNIQDENTFPKPENIYAITKYAGMLTCRYYREKRNVFASCGILYNHESNLRPYNFLSRKVVKAVAAIKNHDATELILGNLDVMVDWGYAPDYVDAMYRILQLDSPADYVIASGKLHSVRQLVEAAFSHVGLDYRDHVSVKDELLNKSIETRVGDASRLSRDTGWKTTISFEEMIGQMVDAELETVTSSND